MCGACVRRSVDGGCGVCCQEHNRHSMIIAGKLEEKQAKRMRREHNAQASPSNLETEEERQQIEDRMAKLGTANRKTLVAIQKAIQPQTPHSSSSFSRFLALALIE